jgi:Protein of unknown function (DUF4013)
MEYGKAFTYPQQDPDWIKKVIIAGVLYMVPVVGQLLVAGYALEITRRVIENNPQVLPDWTDWGNLFKKGLYSLVVGLVYALPLLIIGICLGSAVGGLIAMTASSSDSNTANTLGTVIPIVYSCMMCLVLLYALFMGTVIPAAMGRVAATDQLGAAFKFGEVIGLARSKLGTYFIVMLISALSISVLSSLGSIACGIGAFVGIAYALLVGAHLHGQAYLAPTTAK